MRMAKASAVILCTLLAVLLASTASAARPCKTLFISSFTISTIPRNPNLVHIRFPKYVTVFTQFNPKFDDLLFDASESQQQESPFDAYGLSSVRDRTKDILSVVVALLFGVGCGALTAATMYLAWSLFSSSSHDDYNDYDIPSPKKMGYVSIPCAALDDDTNNLKPSKQGA